VLEFAALAAVLIVIPGPSVLFTVSRALAAPPPWPPSVSFSCTWSPNSGATAAAMNTLYAAA
jgi:hypothetical protein